MREREVEWRGIVVEMGGSKLEATRKTDRK